MAVEETKKLISQYGSDLKILKTIGYHEANSIIKNNLTIDKAIELTSTRTIQFAKRQKHGFVKKNNPIWLITKPSKRCNN